MNSTCLMRVYGSFFVNQSNRVSSHLVKGFEVLCRSNGRKASPLELWVSCMYLKAFLFRGVKYENRA